MRHLLTEPESVDPNFVRTALEKRRKPQHQLPKANSSSCLNDALASVSAQLPFGHSPGGLMIVGPLRMRYKEALTVAHGVSELVAEQLEPASLN